VEFVHQCSFCGFERPGAGAVMLPPSCPDCGCLLDALERGEFERRARAGEPIPEPIVLKKPLARALAVLFAAILLLASGRYGFVNGGLFGALIAIGAAGFLLLPFVPERLAAGRG
jgi:hypothetical protein